MAQNSFIHYLINTYVSCWGYLALTKVTADNDGNGGDNVNDYGENYGKFNYLYMIYNEEDDDDM